jgi:predicted nucleic acid-binding protein
VRVYLDSDVIIWLLRGDRKARELFQTLRDDDDVDLCTGAMQRAEIVFFMRPDERNVTIEFLSLIHTEPLTEGIVDLGGTFFRRWRPSHAIDMNDALLAATAASTGGKILTLNMKDFPMPDIVVERAWE